MNTTQNINAGVNTQMAAALHNANVDSIIKTSEAPLHSPMLVCRKTLLNERIVFIAETQDREANTIQFWAGKKGDKTLTTAPLEFYKSTKPIDSEEDVKALVQVYSTTFKVSSVIVRQRLVKESSIKRDEAGNTSTVNVDEYKQKLIVAITKAIMES